MSIDVPNECEKDLEAYAEGVRREDNAKKALAAAVLEERAAREARQELWRKLNIHLVQGRIHPGIYRLNKGPGLYAEGLLIELNHDYPNLFPMFR